MKYMLIIYGGRRVVAGQRAVFSIHRLRTA